MNQTWNSRANATQTLDFNNISYDYHLNKQDGGPLHPTDIDGVMELHSTRSHPLKLNGIVFLEYKCRDVIMAPGSGQRTALETIARRAASDDLLTRVLEVMHYVYDADEDIDAGSCYIYRIYDGNAGEWRHPETPITVSDYLEQFIATLKTGEVVGT